MLKKLWTYLTEKDYETRQQILGLRILMFFGLAVLLFPLFYSYFTPEISESQKEKELDSLKFIYASKIDSLSKIHPERYREKKSYYTSAEDEEFGATEHAQNNYYSSKDKRDDRESHPSKVKFEPREIHKFNLNTASKEDLKEVNGIGDVFAERILKYRDRLGGFYSSDQLYEVYGIDSNSVINCKKHLEGSIIPSKVLKINSEEFKILLKHPYLEYEEVKLIFKNRPIGSKESLCRIFPEKCEKLSPYFTYD